MEKVVEKMKWLIYPLSFLLVFQGCTVYHTYNSSLEEVLASEKAVKLILESGDVHKFKKIERKEGKIYGLKYNKSRSHAYWSSREAIATNKQTLTYVQIYDNELQNIHLKNKSLSTVLTVMIPVVTIAAIAGLGYAAASNVELDWSNVNIDYSK